MAKIRSGILSKTLGKVGGVVGSSWRGKNYIREYVIPRNPKTAKQTAQRGKMAGIMPLVRAWLIGYIQPFYKARAKGMSEANLFVRENIDCFGADGNIGALKLVSGELPIVTVQQAVRNDTHRLTVTVAIPLNTMPNETSDACLLYYNDSTKQGGVGRLSGAFNYYTMKDGQYSFSFDIGAACEVGDTVYTWFFVHANKNGVNDVSPAAFKLAA